MIKLLLEKILSKQGPRVSCYFNLHKLIFSVKQGRLPVQHFDWLFLRSVSFHVNPSGRERVLKEKRKCVHAFVRGEFVAGSRIGEGKSYLDLGFQNLTDEIRVRYNPYLYSYFFRATTLKPVYKGESCLLANKQIYLLNTLPDSSMLTAPLVSIKEGKIPTKSV